MRHIFGICLFIITSLVNVSSAGPSLKRVTVYGLKPIGVSSELTASLQEHLESRLLSAGTFDVLSRSDMELVMGENRFQQSGACTDEECLVQTGSLLGVELLVTGTLSRIGQTYNLVLKLIDVRSARLEASTTRKHTGTIDGLLDVSENALRELISPLKPAPDTIVKTVVRTRTDTLTLRDTVYTVTPSPVRKEVQTVPASRPAKVAMSDKQRLRSRRLSAGALTILGVIAAGLVTYQCTDR